MKKKLNINNPAMRLIQSMQEKEGNAEESEPIITPAPSPIPKKRISNPILSQPTYERTDAYAENAPFTRRAPKGRETKSKRLNVLIRPSLHEALSLLAEERNTSINELINLGMQEYINRNL